MLTLEQLKDLALLQTHRMTMLEIALAQSQNVSEQLAQQNEELRGQPPKDAAEPAPLDDAQNVPGTGGKGPAEFPPLDALGTDE